MATIALYANKINQMPGLIKEVKKSVTDYKSELSELRTKSLTINKSVCNLDDVISSIQTSSQTQEQKIASLDAFNQNSEQFTSDAARIDSNVADIVKKRRDDFYDKYNYLKPECEKDWLEEIGDWLVSAGEWCREHWKEILVTIVIVIGAVLAIAAVICTGGMALAPLMAAGLTALGVSAGTAMTIATVTSLVVAGIAIASTLASSTLNIIDTWCDMSNNPTFKSWQTAMNWTSAISNGFYSIGSIYNSFKGISNASLREYSRNWVTNGDFRSAIWNADKFGLTLQPNSSNFWAGLGENGAELAERYAAEAGRSTLGQTLSEQGFNIDDITNWTPASASYAMNSSGSVAVNLGDDVGRVLFDASGREIGVIGNIWLNTERILLNVNPNVTSIIINGIVIPRVFQWGSLFSGIFSLGESVINAAN